MAASEPTSSGATRSFDLELLKILCCPETHQELRLADAALLEMVNRRILEGTIQNRGGQPVSEKLEAGLIRADCKCIYPMRNQIPVLLVAESIPVA